MPTTSARLLSLLSLLQARRDWPGGVLAERLEVSPRTVRRDVDRLRELGYPIASSKGPDGGYRLEAGSELPPLLFDDEQAVAVAVALQVATTAGAGVEEAALRALSTVRQVMPARLRARVDRLQVQVLEAPSTRPRPRVDSAVLLALGAAVHAGEVLRFDYGDGPDAVLRRAEPHHLVSWGGRWYVVGYDLDRDDWRTFRVDRISPRVPNGPRFASRELPTGDVATFVASRFRGSGTADWPCRGEVLLDRPAAHVLTYDRDAVVEPVGGSRCRVSAGSWSWPALAARLLGFDAHVEVVGPPELAAAFGLLAGRCGAAAG